MRIKTPLNKDTIRQHLTYSGWKYLIMAVIVVFGWSLYFTMTQYKSPQDKRIDVYVLSSSVSQDVLDAFMEPIWKETVPEMETVEGVLLIDTGDYNTTMQISTYIAAGEGDIYILTSELFKSYAGQGAFLNLDELAENGTLDLNGIDVAKGRVSVIVDYDENFEPISAEQHLFGIPLDSFDGYWEKLQLDNRGMVAAIMVNNQNDENVIPFFNAFLQAGRGEASQDTQEQ